MRPRKPRYALIERRVLELLTESGVEAPPVPINEIIRSRGIELRIAELGKEASGVLVRDGTSLVIGVNRQHARTRQRFTAAHELGHALLHEGDPVHYDPGFRVNLRSELSSQGVDVEEMEANHFAACILMPSLFLQAIPDVFLIDIEDSTALEPLAKKFGVSPLAMALRLSRLGERNRTNRQGILI
jgi:Zn-dependent peptidase ImmA (M78 family)